MVEKTNIYTLYKKVTVLLCGLALLGACLLSFTDTAFAEITKTARAELTDERDKLHIGSYIYLTADPDKKLQYQTVITRHKNNLRGKRQKHDLINLGLRAAPSWMVFSVTNNSSREEWILHFGRLGNGRTALAHKLLVRNSSTGETFTRALREAEVEKAFDEDLNGPALPIKISKGQTELIAIYIEAEGGLPNTISPMLLTPKSHINTLRFGDFFSMLGSIFFIGMLGFFAAAAYLKRERLFLLFPAYYLSNMLLFFALNRFFFASFSYAGEMLSLLFAANLLAGLAITKYFLNVSNEQSTGNMMIFASGVLVIFSTLLNTVLFGEASILSDLLVFLPALIALSVMAAAAFMQGQAGKHGGFYMALGWLSMLAGTLITGFSAAGIPPPSAVTMNMYWLALLPQAFFFIMAVQEQMQTTVQEQRHVQSRESRAAQSLARLQQSKESADQARLLRVIERERELMAELREREILRTEEMRRAKVMADEANRAKSAFLAVVSHEIRTPMTGILGMVRLLSGTKLSKEQNDYAQAIQNSGDTMMALLNDILDFEKIESGNMELESIDFDVLNLVQGVVTLMSGHADEKSIVLQSDIPENFPRYLVGDPTRLRQILLNLVNNAIKFTAQGSVTIRLKASKIKGQPVGANDHDIYFGVEDTGIGIAEDVQKTLFTAFSQADKSTTRKYGGTGLGLAICKRLTEAMGSAMQIESSEGHGSTFFFTAKMAQGEPEVAGTTGATGSGTPTPVEPMQILVVEDNEMNRRVLQGFLEKDGHHVMLSESGERALEILGSKPFDVILSDINLSGMSGIDFTQTVRKLSDRDRASTPIIAITGNVALSDVEEYYRMGLNGFIAKPIDPDKLSQALAKVHAGMLDSPVVLPELPKEEKVQVTNSENPPGTKDDFTYDNNEVSLSPLHQYVQDLEDEDGPEDFDSFEEAKATFENVEKNTGIDETVFDQSMLNNLLESLGQEQFGDLIQGFITTADDIISKMIPLKEGGSVDEIRDRAHELKGMAGNFGITELSAIAGDIEKAAQDNNLDTALIGIDKLPDANERAKNAITLWLGGQQQEATASQ